MMSAFDVSARFMLDLENLENRAFLRKVRENLQ